MNGFLILDKPQGLTSHDVVARARRILGTRQIGHLGTLDPLATGVLPLAIGMATRLVEFLEADRKTYAAVMELGTETATQDAEGEVVARRPVPDLGREEVEAVFAAFVGRMKQCPPMYSAVKIGGVPLYRLARKGLEVEREAREIDILELKITEFALPRIVFEVQCSKGTYIRTLCQDLGRALGSAAHMTALRHLRSGVFTVADSVALDDLKADTPLLPLTAGIGGLPRVEVTEEAERKLCHGIPPRLSHVVGDISGLEGEGWVALMRQNRLLAVAVPDFGHVRETRGDFKLKKVFAGT